MVVTAIKNDSAAANHGLRIGDVIVEVDQKAVSTPHQAVDEIEKLRRDGRASVIVRFFRRGVFQLTAIPI